MNVLLALAVSAAGAAFGAPGPGAGDAVRRERERVEGTWRLVEGKVKLAPLDVMQKKGQEGTTGPGLEAAETPRVRGVTFTFKGDELTVAAGRRAFPPGGKFDWERCELRFVPSTTPKTLTLTPPDRAAPAADRRPFGACYLLDGDLLWLCDHGGYADAPTDFSLDVGIAYPKRVFVLRREPTAGRATPGK